MLPQVGIGGCAPNPKKLSPASNKIAEAKFDEASTNIGPTILGKICLLMIRVLLNPKERAASIYSTCFKLKTWPRTRRATSTHMDKPTAIKICQSPLPKAKDIAITNSNAGNAHNMFISQLKAASAQPPK